MFMALKTRSRSEHYRKEKAQKRRFRRYTIVIAALLFTGALLFNNLTVHKVKAAIAFDANLTSSPTHNNAQSTTVAVTTTTAAAASSKIIAVVGWWANLSVTLTGVSGGSLNWNIDKTASNAGGDRIAIVSADSSGSLASGTTLTATFSSNVAGGRSMAAMSFTGVATGSTYDGTNSNNNTTGSAWDSGSISTTNNNDLLIGYGLSDLGTGTGSASPDANWNEVHDWGDATAATNWESVYRVVSSTGSYTAGGTFTTGTTHLGAAVAYKAHANEPLMVDFKQSTFTDTAANEVTGSATWQSGDLIVVIGGTENGSQTLGTPTATGLAFSLVTSSGVGSSSNSTAYLWSATAGSNGSGTITSTGTTAMHGITVFVYRSSLGLGNNNSISASSATTISLNHASANSEVLSFLSDWNATNDTVVTPSPSAGGTQRVADTIQGPPLATMFVDEWTDQGSAGTTSYGITNFTGTPKMNGIAVEVKGTAANSAPAAPTLSSPANSATGVALAPQLQLRTTDTDNDYLRYEVQICSTNNCSSVVRTVCQDSNLPNSCTGSQTGWSGQDLQTSTAYTGNSTIASSTLATYTYQLPPLSPSTQYWWRAYAIDPGGTNTSSSVSSIFSFTTASNSSPAAPTLVSPSSGETAVSMAPLFQLRTTDADSDYLQYFIQLYDAASCGGSQVGSNIDQTSLQTNWQAQDAGSSTAYVGSSSIGSSTIARYQYAGTSLSSNHTYSWRAKAIDPAGTNAFGSLSSCQSFTTGSSEVQINGGTQINGGSTIQ
jgi:hypothetical protein